jgi:hypothetical protein
MAMSHEPRGNDCFGISFGHHPFADKLFTPIGFGHLVNKGKFKSKQDAKMTTAIVSVVLAFLLTGVVGNALVHRWQLRNWVSQQKFLGEEKRYYSLVALWEEVTKLGAKRLWRMRRLLSALADEDTDKIKERVIAYDSALSEWNESFHSVGARLTLFASWKLDRELEEELQRAFLNAGLKLERLTRSRLAGGAVDKRIAHELRLEFFDLSRLLFRFNRDTLRMVERQRSITYYGVEVELTKDNLETFGTWELAKALFKPGIEPFRVIRPSADLRPPFRGRV